MTVIEAIFLGLVQGLAEFLPISSSGHLSVFQNLLGITTGESSMMFDVLLHLGTLVSVCVFYWQDLTNIVKECIDMVRGVGQPVPGGQKRYSGVRLLVMMFFATLPLLLVLPLQDHVERLYDSTVFIGIAFLLTGAMLYLADRMPRGGKTEKNMRIRDALVIGLCQGVATMPGLSRSGTTITAGLSVGLNRQFAVKFSFLISIPAILGANLLQLVKAIKEGVDIAMMPTYLLGLLVAMVVGYFALSLVQYISRKGKFGWFAYYCWFAGVVTLILTIIH